MRRCWKRACTWVWCCRSWRALGGGGRRCGGAWRRGGRRRPRRRARRGGCPRGAGVARGGLLPRRFAGADLSPVGSPCPCGGLTRGEEAMSLGTTVVLYLLLGVGVAIAVAARGSGSRGELIFRVLSAIVFWPLF